MHLVHQLPRLEGIDIDVNGIPNEPAQDKIEGKQGDPGGIVNPTATGESAPIRRRAEGILPLWETEKLAIEDAINSCSGNIPKAAALLGISASTIYRKRQHWETLEAKD